MGDTSKIAKNLRAFQIAINAHDRENPTHNSWGIGLAHFDLDRLGFDEGEEVLPGITIQADNGVTGNFRILCDGDHDAELSEQEAEVVEVVGSQPVAIPAGAPETRGLMWVSRVRATAPDGAGSPPTGSPIVSTMGFTLVRRPAPPDTAPRTRSNRHQTSRRQT